jgi:hypothetical protein
MISNERPNYRGRQPQEYYGPPRPILEEYTLNKGVLQIKHKEFVLSLKVNVHGLFVRIVEHNSDRVSSTMIPESGLEDFYAVVLQMVEADKEFQPAVNPSGSRNLEPQ